MVWPAIVAMGIGAGWFLSPDGDSMFFVEALKGQGEPRRVAELMELLINGPKSLSVLLREGAPGWIGTRNGVTDIRGPLPNGRLVGPPLCTMAGEGLWGSGPAMAVTVECIIGPDGAKKVMEVVISPAPAIDNEFSGSATPEGTGWGATDCREGIVP